MPMVVNDCAAAGDVDSTAFNNGLMVDFVIMMMMMSQGWYLMIR